MDERLAVGLRMMRMMTVMKMLMMMINGALRIDSNMICTGLQDSEEANQPQPV